MNPIPRRTLLILALALQPACAAKWTGVSLPHPDSAAWSPPGGLIRVVRTPAESITVDAALWRNDSLILGRIGEGQVAVPRAELVSVERYGVPMSEGTGLLLSLWLLFGMFGLILSPPGGGISGGF